MKTMKLAQLVQEAHGCSMPEASSHYLEDLGSDFLYDVYLWDWGVKITVPVPASFVGFWMKGDVCPPKFQVRAQDAVAYGLVTYGTQSQSVRDYLKGRFGPMLNQARTMAFDYWKGMEKWNA